MMNANRNAVLCCALALLATLCAARADAAPATGGADLSKVPGVVIAHVPAASGIYIGSPSIAALPDGSYLASHDEFGPKSGYHTSSVTRVLRSADRGKSWQQIARMNPALWCTLFPHRDALYLIGVEKEHGKLLIRRSTDGGRTWTSPTGKKTGLLREGEWHTAPVPVIEHNGRLWRGVEDAMGGGGWGERYRARMMSIPIDADLLDADAWTISEPLPRDPKWMGGRFIGWLEGNAVISPTGKVVNVLRVNARDDFGTAAIAHVAPDGKTMSFDPAADLIKLPGGDKKFTIRFDPKTKRYWTLGSVVLPPFVGKGNPGDVRNTIGLMSSADLRTWETRSIVLYHPKVRNHGFQYLDWLFEGDDLIAVSRTAFEDGLGGAHRTHDANLMTFHRVKNFRDLTMSDSVPMPVAERVSLAGKGLAVSGTGFEASALKDGQRAFANRPYTWRGVPERFRDWSYTRLDGGAAAQIEVVASADGDLHVATAPSQPGPDLAGFEPVPGGTFTYNDGGNTAMQVYRRAVKAGESVAVPQGNWAGVIVLVPPADDPPAAAAGGNGR